MYIGLEVSKTTFKFNWLLFKNFSNFLMPISESFTHLLLKLQYYETAREKPLINHSSEKQMTNGPCHLLVNNWNIISGSCDYKKYRYAFMFQEINPAQLLLIWDYRRTSNIMRTKSQNLNVSHLISSCICFCPIHWSQLLRRHSWSSADNFIAYWGVFWYKRFDGSSII